MDIRTVVIANKITLFERLTRNGPDARLKALFDARAPIVTKIEASHCATVGTRDRVRQELERAGAWTETQLDAGIGVRRLAESGILTQHRGGRVGFRHALLRDTVYQSVPAPQREIIHRAAYDYYRAFNPAAYNDRAEIRQVEPYVHCQTTYSRYNVNEGVSRTSWLSGTASWAYYAATHWLLGVRPEVDGLRIDPCIPKAWPGFTMRRRFRDQTEPVRPRRLSFAILMASSSVS